MRNVIALLAATGLVVLTACASREVADPRRTGTSVTIQPSAVGHAGTATPTTVAWVNRPAPPYLEPTPTPTKYPTGARACHATDLRVESGQLGAAGGTANIRVEFTNRSRDVCVLLGYPSVAGVSADGTVTPLHARHDSIVGVAPWPAADIAPGERAAVNISSADGCPAAQRRRFRPLYPRLRIGLPAGRFMDVSSHGLDTVCGVEVSRFGVPALAAPPHEPRPSPLNVHMSGPATAHAGEEIVYSVTLRNPTGTAYRFTPCPAYEEYVGLGTGSYVHPNYYLNCDTVHEIPPGAAVTYQMRLHLPADFHGTGSAKFGWLIQGNAGPAAADIIRITR